VKVHFAGAEHLAVLDERPSGVGTTVWVGELRTRDGRPVVGYYDSNMLTVQESPRTGLHRCLPVAVGVSESQVLGLLSTRARTIEQAAGR
jgi:hypothetical protein